MPVLNIIQNDSDVAALTQPALRMLESVVNRFDLEANIYLFESIHGHSARLMRKEGRFIPGSENHLMRMDTEDASFFLSLPGIRWFECATDHIQVGFDNRVCEAQLDPLKHLCYTAALHLVSAVEPGWRSQAKVKPYLSSMVEKSHQAVKAAGGIEEFNQTLTHYGRSDLKVSEYVNLSRAS